MDAGPDADLLDAILANLGREVRRPLDQLQAALDRLLDDAADPSSEAERAHARTMIQLCEDLRRLTAETLGPRTPAAG